MRSWGCAGVRSGGPGWWAAPTMASGRDGGHVCVHRVHVVLVPAAGSAPPGPWCTLTGMSARTPLPPRRLVRSLAGQLFLVQVVIVAAVVAGGAVLAYLFTAGRADDAARRQVTAVARAVADSPTVLDAAGAPDPTAVLQPYAERVRVDTGVSFVTVMDTAGVRWTHPLPEQIGRPFLGHIDWALAGRPAARPTPARSARRCGWSPRCWTSGTGWWRWSARASRCSRSRPGCAVRCSPWWGSRGPRWPSAGSAPTSPTPGCGGTPTAWGRPSSATSTSTTRPPCTPSGRGSSCSTASTGWCSATTPRANSWAWRGRWRAARSTGWDCRTRCWRPSPGTRRSGTRSI